MERLFHKIRNFFGARNGRKEPRPRSFVIPERLRLRDVLMWESLTGKDFSSLDGSKEDDVLRLMYCCWCGEHGERRRFTYEIWSSVVKEEYASDIIVFSMRINADIKYVNQFIGLPAMYDDTNGEALNAKDRSKDYLTDVITYAMMSGIDTRWLLEQGVEILPVLKRGESLRYQARMDEARFWAYINLSPYRDKKENKSISEWLPMPWDKKQKRMGSVSQSEVEWARMMLNKNKESNNE